MLSTKLKEAAGNSADATLYVDDVFSTYLYTGNNVDGRLIQNDIDLLTKGGMVWIKARSSAQYHTVADTNRGMTNTPQLATNTNESASGYYISSYANNGFSVYGGAYGPGANATGITYASWTFRKAAKFFDVVTYTGNGVNGRAIPHSLGVAPGMIIVKSTSNVSDWITWHRSLSVPTNRALYLNGTQSELTSAYFPTLPSSSVFYTNGDGYDVNTAGQTYVAYLFAHDTSSTGIIQCGSFTSDASGNVPNVTLGWEPQYLLYKRSDGGAVNWYVMDSMRGFPVSGNASRLYPNLTAAEQVSSYEPIPTATGLTWLTGSYGATQTYIYMAIRMPNKPPTTGTQVFNAIARTGTGAAATVTGVGFAPDTVMFADRLRNSSNFTMISDRLRGTTDGTSGSSRLLKTNDTGAELVDSSFLDNIRSLTMDGFNVGSDYLQYINKSGLAYINHAFKRAPGFFDVVCYTGTGVARTVAHNLTVAPELMIVKSRSNAANWTVYVNSLGNTGVLLLQGINAASTGNNTWNNTTPTSSVFSLGTQLSVNGSGYTFVAYLFATLAGISKVGSYTGNGTTQTINCGFTGGARFVLIKRTDSTGDWYVFDTARGMTTLTDPYLLLNSTAAEVATLGAVTSVTTGFAVNAAIVAAINTNAASYIFLAIA